MRWLAALGLVAVVHVSAPSVGAWEEWPGEWHPGRPAAVSVEDDMGAAPSRIEAEVFRLEAGAFRLEVPFRTQKDGGRWQGSNCGPAILGMILDGFGIVGQATDDLRFQSHTYQGTWGMRTGTALQHLARVAADFGVPTFGLYDDDDQFHAWSPDELREQLRLGRPVIVLVRLYLLPGKENVGARWGHYILLTGLDGDEFLYSDPLQTELDAGTGGRIGGAQLERAMYASLVPGQAVAFGSPDGSRLNISAPEGPS